MNKGSSSIMINKLNLFIIQKITFCFYLLIFLIKINLYELNYQLRLVNILISFFIKLVEKYQKNY